MENTFTKTTIYKNFISNLEERVDLIDRPIHTDPVGYIEHRIRDDIISGKLKPTIFSSFDKISQSSCFLLNEIETQKSEKCVLFQVEGGSARGQTDKNFTSGFFFDESEGLIDTSIHTSDSGNIEHRFKDGQTINRIEDVD